MLLTTTRNRKEHIQLQELITKFQEIYQSDDIRAVRSPLRICPIGAHSDHQGGRVTGMPLDASVDMMNAAMGALKAPRTLASKISLEGSLARPLILSASITSLSRKPFLIEKFLF